MATKTRIKPKKPPAAKPKTKGTAKPVARGKPAKAAAPRPARRNADKAASRPEVSEIVAAALVGAAAALRDPNKARQLVASVGEEIEQAAKGAAGQGAAIWQLAMDVAKRSVDALGAVAKPDSKDKKKKKKKKK
jgi:hypothetical protein